VLAHTPIAPPVVRLGRRFGWSPLPLSVRDARAAATTLRTQLQGLKPADATTDPSAATIGTLRNVVVDYDGVIALAGVDFDVRRGEVVAVMGRNGAGKSTMLNLLAGLNAPRGGAVTVDGVAPARLSAADAVRRVALVPQNPADLLSADTVATECRDADREAGVASGATAQMLESLAPGIAPETHPRDLSEGQRLALALAVLLARRPPLLLLDEPTRGLDYTAKEKLSEIIRSLAADGHAVVFATHDVELVAEVASRVVVLAEGEVVSDGPTDDVVTASPAFAPQVAKILAPLPWLTVAQVEAALAG
jgi:energy-coupling factor transport system ATP-binding protein